MFSKFNKYTYFSYTHNMAQTAPVKPQATAPHPHGGQKPFLPLFPPSSVCQFSQPRVGCRTKCLILQWHRQSGRDLRPGRGYHEVSPSCPPTDPRAASVSQGGCPLSARAALAEDADSKLLIILY